MLLRYSSLLLSLKNEVDSLSIQIEVRDVFFVIGKWVIAKNIKKNEEEVNESMSTLSSVAVC